MFFDIFKPKKPKNARERYEEMLACRYQIIEKYDNVFKDLGVSVLKHKTSTKTSIKTATKKRSDCSGL